MKTVFGFANHLRILFIMCMILNCCGSDEQDDENDIGIDVDQENTIAFTSDRDENI